ncbi:hypothetical protein DSCOOX_56330 [Desulfosarcina ovata subsp. ovata]|uniref:Uncharacterized protein n=1 Tax=Desulfosarcina ovata subsp. ovata TaxID=2752305 RepID=A0A5K8AIE7_9BACT|nr:hypothetical protein DSCOOX_56330 [Desulfosarcina ovata subsp. ovata]
MGRFLTIQGFCFFMTKGSADLEKLRNEQGRYLNVIGDSE